MLQWLLRGDLKGESESELITTQDLVLQTKKTMQQKYYKKTDSKCRL